MVKALITQLLMQTVKATSKRTQRHCCTTLNASHGKEQPLASASVLAFPRWLTWNLLREVSVVLLRDTLHFSHTCQRERMRHKV